MAAPVPGTTTLALRTSKRLTCQALLQHSHHYCGPVWQQKPYDCVYMPASNLAIINFTSPEACSATYQVLNMLAGTRGIVVTEVRPAQYQGLAENLAEFEASAFQPDSRRRAPQVFSNGQRVSLQAACQKCLTPELREKHRILRLTRNHGSQNILVDAFRFTEDAEGPVASSETVAARTDLPPVSAESGRQTSFGSLEGTSDLNVLEDTHCNGPR
ncbi:unnamed protein product [Symbiodinium natans]|uniref:Uncharacterized protein n=1 Tax=Symbiodinium natans TaxID=878477 RepID=A0A812K5K1_9DINO|nr:unnamed protein product [Symbiodinium natans]